MNRENSSKRSLSLFYSLSTINVRVIGPFLSNIIIFHFSKNWKLVFKLAKRGGGGGNSIHPSIQIRSMDTVIRAQTRIKDITLKLPRSPVDALFLLSISPIFRTDCTVPNQLSQTLPSLSLSLSPFLSVSPRSKYCFVPFAANSSLLFEKNK